MGIIGAFREGETLAMNAAIEAARAGDAEARLRGGAMRSRSWPNRRFEPQADRNADGVTER